MTWWRIGDEDIVEWSERKGSQIFDMAKYYGKEVAKASRELHTIIDSPDAMMNSWRSIHVERTLWSCPSDSSPSQLAIGVWQMPLVVVSGAEPFLIPLCILFLLEVFISGLCHRP